MYVDREDKADLEDFKVKAYNYYYRIIYRQIKSTLSIVKLSASLRTIRLKKESNLKYRTLRSITTRKSR